MLQASTADACVVWHVLMPTWLCHAQVVDAADVARLHLCRAELQRLLHEEKLAGATLLILANKQDLPGALSAAQIKQAGNFAM